MAAPTSYSESGLATFMVVELGGTASALGWVAATAQVVAAVYAVERQLEVTDVASVTDMAALEVLARLSIWRAAKSGLAAFVDTTIDNESLKDSKLFENAAAMVAEYEQQASVIGAGGVGVVTIHPVVRSEDPYAVSDLTGTEF